MKICITCKLEKTLNDFYLHVNQCKDCVKRRVRAYRSAGRHLGTEKKRALNPKRREWQRLNSKKMELKHKKKKLAKKLWRLWFRKNPRLRQSCSKCNEVKRIEAHHSDYNKPLNIIWFCSKHHKEWHRNNEALNQE